MREVWKNTTYHGYKVSSHGRVMGPKKEVKLHKSERGYFRVSFYINGKNIKKYAHCLVAEAFYGKKKEGQQVNHINGIKTDNYYKNLEYVTCKENVRHALNAGIFNRKRLTVQQVLQIRKMNKCSGGEAITIAKLFGVSVDAVLNVKRGRTYKKIK